MQPLFDQIRIALDDVRAADSYAMIIDLSREGGEHPDDWHLAHFVNPHWIWLAVFVGCNLIQSALTGFCPAAVVFKRLGVKGGEVFR